MNPRTNMQKEIDEIDVCGGTVKSGALLPLWALAKKEPALAGLSDDTPVLTCSINARLAEFFESCEQGGRLSFGFFQTREPHFIRWCCSDVEIHWLIDYFDPEIWEAVFKWKLAGRVPIRFEVAGAGQARYVISTASMPPDIRPFDEPRSHGGDEPTAHMWTCLTALAKNGNWQYDEVSGEIYEIPTVPLRFSLFRVLLTRRWLAYLNRAESL
ncbi:hypothetical protein BJN34_22100 [Cupriavidus necator]|uniref:Uncharacterized protein n=2 Tax=Cupriavidus necator TaxID=106590 RepID=A0A1U9UV65_CUPNE|nr:hypothetical protein BJN34_22100 [Cupriavidus necator]